MPEASAPFRYVIHITIPILYHNQASRIRAHRTCMVVLRPDSVAVQMIRPPRQPAGASEGHSDCPSVRFGRPI